MTPPHERLLLRIPEAAAYVSVSERTMRNWLHDGVVPSVYVGTVRRVPRKALDALVERQLREQEELAAALRAKRERRRGLTRTQQTG